MKLFLAAFTLVIFFFPSEHFAQDSTKLIGTWELASYKYTLPDTVITGTGANFTSIKIVTPQFFVYVGQTMPAKEFKRAGGGRYMVKGEVLQELMMFSSIQNMLGKTYQYKCAVKEDTWY
ncbi:MAG: hypothetical protein HKM87_05840, partial [Ignavibacteriaceae bacterium]|nr:hypothetical protein [Ignavibacteriaceae bacterium]